LNTVGGSKEMEHEAPGTFYDPALGQDEQLPLLEYLQLLWFRKWTIIAITVLSGIAGWVWVNQETPVYRAASTVMVGNPNFGIANPEMMMLAYFSRLKAVDELEVLKSRNLAEQVVESLDLLSYPEFNPALRHTEPGLFDWFNPREWIPQRWKETTRSALDREPQKPGVDRAIEEDRERRQLITAAGILLGGLDLSNDQMSNVIMVGFRSTNPELAAMIANELPEVYMLSTLQARYESTEKTTKWLSERLDELRQEVEDAERAVEIYRSDHGLTEVGGTGLLAEQLSVLNSQLIIAKAERAEAEARLSQVRQLLLGDEAAAEAATRLVDSTLIQQLKTQEVQAQRVVSELSVEYGPKHPRMLQAQAEVAQLRERIDDEVSKIEFALRSDVEFARARESSLAASLREAETATGAQNREAIQLRALEREAAATRALFETFLEQFKQASSSEGLNEPGVRVLSRAQVPGAPFYPNVRRQTTVITFGGFALAVLLVFALEALNPGITNPEQVERELGRHTIGIIPLASGSVKAHDLPIDKPRSGYVEALNSLMVSLTLTDPDREPRVFQLTSSIPEEGKTTLALSLARMLANRGKRVILVDGDLRRGALEKKLGVSKQEKGLTDLVLAPEQAIGSYLAEDPKSDVRVMPPGSAEFVNAADIFSSQRIKNIVRDLRAEADYVIFDTPPVMAVADARLIGRFVEKTLFVVRWNKTPVKVSKAALKLLTEGGTDVAGIVLQGVDLKRFGRLGYGDSGYYYHYGRYGQYYKG
jgi:capsular exopolysaccharide synthesis family protein